MLKTLSNFKNIFIIGPTKSGKTTTAKQLANILKRPEDSVISMSEFFRKAFEDKNVYQNISRDDISKFSLTILQKDININLKYVEEKNKNLGYDQYIYEGFRNPYEFMKLFNPETDFVFFLNPSSTMTKGFYSSTFEKTGLATISKNILWLSESFGFNSYTSTHYNSYEELRNSISNILNEQFYCNEDI